MKKLNKKLKQSVIATAVCLSALIVCHFFDGGMIETVIKLAALGGLVIVYIRTFAD